MGEVSKGKINLTLQRILQLLCISTKEIYVLVIFLKGSTWDAPTWSGYVVEMRLMDARGRLRRFTKERFPELMKALMANIGMMGIMYDITIQVNDTLIGMVKHEFLPLETLFYNQTKLREIVTGNFLTEITWYPFNSVTPEEEAVYLHNNTVPDTWSVKRDTIWLR